MGSRISNSSTKISTPSIRGISTLLRAVKTKCGRMLKTTSVDAIMPKQVGNRVALKSLNERQINTTYELNALVRQNQQKSKPSAFDKLASAGRDIDSKSANALKHIKELDTALRNQYSQKSITLEQTFRIRSIMTGKLLLIAKNPDKVSELSKPLVTKLIGPERAKDVIKAMDKTIDGNLEARLINLKMPDVPTHKPK